MRNVHHRQFAASPEQLRHFLESVWTGTGQDIFPRDVLASWRRNPPGAPPLASLPGQTEVGHGPFKFRLTEWDGARWRVSIRSATINGWHGFDLASREGGAVLTHTLEADLRGTALLVWPLVIAPMHDWVLEAMFDRLETALKTGAVPARTERPMPWHVRLLFSLGGRALPRSTTSAVPA